MQDLLDAAVLAVARRCLAIFGVEPKPDPVALSRERWRQEQAEKSAQRARERAEYETAVAAWLDTDMSASKPRPPHWLAHEEAERFRLAKKFAGRGQRRRRRGQRRRWK